MFKTEEFIHIILGTIIIAFAVSFKQFVNLKVNYDFILLALLTIITIMLINTLAKKITANYFEAKLETKIWDMKRYGMRRHHYFKKPVPIGIILPFFITIATLGSFPWMAVLESDIEKTSARAAKKHGIYRFTEMTDIHLSLIAGSGVLICLILSAIGYVINLPELALWSTYYAAFSLVPLGKLDGSKIFFGSRVVWMTLAVITAIFLFYALNRSWIFTILTVIAILIVFLISKKLD